MMYNGFGTGMMWLLWLWGLLVLAGIVYLVIASVTDRRSGRQPQPSTGGAQGHAERNVSPTQPRDLLGQRYARGEMTTEEYTERLQVLTQTTER